MDELTLFEAVENAEDLKNYTYFNLQRHFDKLTEFDFAFRNGFNVC